MPITEGDPTGDIKPDKNDNSPEGQVVNDFHTNDDLDRSKQAHHHSIGIAANKVNSGLHDHGGKDSRKIAANRTDLVLTGKLTPTTVAEGDAIMDSLITMLKQVINFQDNRA